MNSCRTTVHQGPCYLWCSLKVVENWFEIDGRKYFLRVFSKVQERIFDSFASIRDWMEVATFLSDSETDTVIIKSLIFSIFRVLASSVTDCCFLDVEMSLSTYLFISHCNCWIYLWNKKEMNSSYSFQNCHAKINHKHNLGNLSDCN